MIPGMGKMNPKQMQGLMKQFGIKSEEIKFGRNSFIEIARKVAKTDEGENEFISISKGFFLPDGTKRFSKGKNVSIPNEKEVVEDIAKKLKAVL